MAKVLLGMSGGIDSSVAALLLQRQGHEVEGITMCLCNGKCAACGRPGRTSCFSPDKADDIAKAAQICARLGIRHHVVDLSDRFADTVLADFRNCYINGTTPNPCVLCNPTIKFGAMQEAAKAEGIEYDLFATGHYARTAVETTADGRSRTVLLRGADEVKDQSYFLYRLSQEQLSNVVFPLGGMSKSQARAMDVAEGYHDADQGESQDFYSGHYSELLDVRPVEGNIVDAQGRVLGRHNGIWNYTIGQRRGLGVAAPRALYVTALRPRTNEVVVGFEEDTLSTRVVADRIVWGAMEGIEGTVRCAAKVRSTGRPAPCTVGLEDGRLVAVFDSPVKAATAGQSLVCYEGDRVLFGGIIVEGE